jgi:ATPase subunit of ABC transporter with duplicated ATPase domains
VNVRWDARLGQFAGTLLGICWLGADTALWDYEGTMLFVSHDRRFLAALSNRVLELTPEGVHQYGGGYT